MEAGQPGHGQVTPDQQVVLVSYMEQHGDLSLGKERSLQARVRNERKWEACARAVNPHGPWQKTAREWAKYWCELKSKVKSKLLLGTELTTLEYRVSEFIVHNTPDTTGTTSNTSIYNKCTIL